MDHTGKTVFHCHIVEHEDVGMMGIWNIEPSEQGALGRAITTVPVSAITPTRPAEFARCGAITCSLD